MQASQPVASPLGILLLIALIYLVVISPKKLKTITRVAIAFVTTAAIFVVIGAILRRGDPEALGRVGGLVALLVAVIVGWRHTRSLKETNPGPPTPPTTNP